MTAWGVANRAGTRSEVPVHSTDQSLPLALRERRDDQGAPTAPRVTWAGKARRCVCITVIDHAIRVTIKPLPGKRKSDD